MEFYGEVLATIKGGKIKYKSIDNWQCTIDN
jgi:hypothetical protein